MITLVVLTPLRLQTSLILHWFKAVVLPCSVLAEIASVLINEFHWIETKERANLPEEMG